MVDVTVLPGFIAVIMMFLIPPGPDMAYMIAVGLEGGRWAALKAILGIVTGMGVYAAAVVAGVGKITQSHPLLLDAVKIFGAAYLLWIAYTTMRSVRVNIEKSGDIASKRWFLRGFLVSLTNPKVILFFLAILSQFIGNAQNITVQMALLSIVVIVTEMVFYGTIGVFAGVFNAHFIGNRTARIILNYIACAVYIALAGIIIIEMLMEVM